MSPHFIPDESSMLKFGEKLSSRVESGSIVFLVGELGSGKTTLVRGILSGLGYDRTVVSPTYTLIEPYPGREFDVYHLDLYRLSRDDELENLGFRDLLDGHAACLIEWPEKGEANLPSPSMTIRIRILEPGREVEIDPGTGQ